MANKYTDAVSDAILPTATMKAVLYTLAKFSDNKTGVCWPGQTLIARLSCCSYSAAQRNLDRLIAMRLVSVTGRHRIKNSNAMFTNEYTLNLEKIKEMSLYAEEQCPIAVSKAFDVDDEDVSVSRAFEIEEDA